MQRHALGIAALVLFAISLFTRDSESAMSGTCLRVGVVIALVWLAYPQLTRVPPWLAAVIVVALLIVVRWPKLIALAIPLIVLLWLLGPRGTRRPTGPTDPRD